MHYEPYSIPESCPQELFLTRSVPNRSNTLRPNIRGSLPEPVCKEKTSTTLDPKPTFKQITPAATLIMGVLTLSWAGSSEIQMAMLVISIILAIFCVLASPDKFGDGLHSQPSRDMILYEPRDMLQKKENLTLLGEKESPYGEKLRNRKEQEKATQMEEWRHAPRPWFS